MVEAALSYVAFIEQENKTMDLQEVIDTRHGYMAVQPEPNACYTRQTLFAIE